LTLAMGVDTLSGDIVGYVERLSDSLTLSHESG
jgi:hypothetical protein